MIDFSNRTKANILAEQLAMIPSKIDKRPLSLIAVSLEPESKALEKCYIDLDLVQKQGFPQTARGEALDLHVALVGLTRKQATPATRLGIIDPNIPLNSRFMALNGSRSINFYIAEEISPGNYKLVAETAGAIGNEYVGPLSQVEVIEGLKSAEITDILIPGTEIESDESLYARYLVRIKAKPFGGNVAQYIENIMNLGGVGGVQVYPTWNGGGTVCCSIIDAEYNQASQTLIDLVQYTIAPLADPEDTASPGDGYGLAPIGAKVTIKTPGKMILNIDFDVNLISGYTIDQVQQPIEEAIDNYLLTLRQKWAAPLVVGGTNYILYIFISQISAAILNVTGVANVTNITINNSADDIIITQTGEDQFLPVLGDVNITSV